MRRFTALVLLMTAGCHADLRLSQRKWIELQSESFILRTDLDEAAARRSIENLEEIRSGFLRAFNWGGEPANHAPFLVVQASDEETSHELSPMVPGFVTRQLWGESFAFVGFEPTAGPMVAQHELAHVIAGEILHDQPAWFSEGLAVFLAPAVIENGQFVVGRLDPRLGSELKPSLRMSAKDVMRAQSAIQFGPRRGLVFELSAYAVFFTLFNQRPAALASYMQVLAQGMDPRAGFKRVFANLSPEHLDTLVTGQLKNGANYSVLRIPVRTYAGDVAVHAMTPIEVHLMLGRIYAGAPDAKPERARAKERAEMTAVLIADPGNPQALEDRFASETMTRDQILAEARRGAELHPEDWRSKLLLASWVLFEDKGAPLSSEARKAAWEESLRLARSAYELAPDNAWVVSRYAASLWLIGRAREALPLARRAVQLDRTGLISLSELSIVLATLGECKEAREVWVRLLASFPEQPAARELSATRDLEKQFDEQCGPAREDAIEGGPAQSEAKPP